MPLSYAPLLGDTTDGIQAKINDFLQSIGSTMKITRKYVDRLQAENCILPLGDNQFLTQVDDELSVVENLAPEMIFATRGRLGVLLHGSESLPQLVDEVLESHPAVVLMDYKLQNNITGIEVTTQLLKHHSTLAIVGFSSNPERQKEFLDVGARGFVHKLASEQMATMRCLLEEFQRIQTAQAMRT